jgi:hypothetical protein
MPDDQFFGDPATMLCAWCSVMHASALCERCRALVASGKNRGPLPSMLIPRVERRECWACSPAGDRKTGALASRNPADAKFCAPHIELANRRRRAVPIEFDEPQVPRTVDAKPPGHFFF